jgi:hypothetical protein
MAIRIADAVREDMVTAVAAAINAGSGPATLEVRTGSQPANADTTASGTLLVTFTLADPATEAPTAGSLPLDLDPDISATAAASGTAGWARLKDSDGNTILDGTVGTSGTDYIITSTTITNGQTVTLISGGYTLPAS